MPIPPEELLRLSKIGPAAARLEIATTDLHGSTQHSVRKQEVRSWIEAEEARLSAEAGDRRDKREDETLSIARSALTNSKRANIIAITAAILATIATVSAAYIAVIFSAPKV